MPMKISEALDKYDYSKRPYIISFDFKLSLIYSLKANSFIWVDKNGKAIEDKMSRSGFKELQTSESMLNNRGWYFSDTTPNMVVQKLKNDIAEYVEMTLDTPQNMLKEIYNILLPRFEVDNENHGNPVPVIFWADEIKNHGNGNIEMIFKSESQ